jgi:murein tripeptide amidase MpaA
MRMPDPHGPWKCHPDEPRLMIPREPGEFGGTYYRLMPEGTLKNFDGLQISTNRDREGLDLNRNFPAYWRQEHEQLGAGPYPTSEPEVRAMVDFIVKHPNIGAAISFHTHSGVILRPMGTRGDDDMTPEDLWMIQALSDIGAKLTGYPAISIFHDFKYHPKEIITGTQDWVYEHLGALFWTVEIWAPNKEAGIDQLQLDRLVPRPPARGRPEAAEVERRAVRRQGAHDWYPFRHPQLGMVELGGWDRLNYWRNPPPHLREREAARFPAWLTQIGLSLPGWSCCVPRCVPGWRHLAHPLRGGQQRLPAGLCDCKRALERKTVRGVVFEIHLPRGPGACRPAS